MQQPNKQASMLPMSQSEIRTLLRMIDMTYLQGLSGSGHYVQDCAGAASMTPMLHNPSQLTNALTQNPTLQQLSNGTLQQLQSSTNNANMNGMNGMNGLGGMGMQMGMGMHGGAGNKNPPPVNYVCHKCNVVGHWIQECPLNTQQQQDYTKPPPANYICHRCGIPGHWIKNCPTNGNPTFDNKPHLKVIKTSEGSQSGSMNGSQPDVNAINPNDGTSNANVTTASQPPSKKRRLNQM
mmetsp:Transcript_38823/g.61954  ORF Transcript_38823/g.61954 Transcript_38823/m.61954 type:complete len:237 (-) Transcript_38823:319-1029(-)